MRIDKVGDDFDDCWRVIVGDDAVDAQGLALGVGIKASVVARTNEFIGTVPRDPRYVYARNTLCQRYSTCVGSSPLSSPSSSRNAAR